MYHTWILWVPPAIQMMGVFMVFIEHVGSGGPPTRNKVFWRVYEPLVPGFPNKAALNPYFLRGGLRLTKTDKTGEKRVQRIPPQTSPTDSGLSSPQTLGICWSNLTNIFFKGVGEKSPTYHQILWMFPRFFVRSSPLWRHFVIAPKLTAAGLHAGWHWTNCWLRWMVLKTTQVHRVGCLAFIRMFLWLAYKTYGLVNISKLGCPVGS